MSENKFDEFFRKKMLKYSSPVPGDMWQRIQAKKEKDRKGFFLKWLLIGLPLLFLAAGYFILHTNKNAGNATAINSGNQPKITRQNISGETGKETEEKEPTKTNRSTVIDKASNKLLPKKNIDNSGKNIYSSGHQNKKPVTIQNFAFKGTSPGGNIMKRKNRPAGYRGTSRPGFDSINIREGEAIDSSINNQADKNITRKDNDTDTNTQVIKKISLSEDSLSTEIKATTGKRSQKENNLSSREKKWFLDVYASPDIPINEIRSGNPATTDFIKKNFKTHLSYTAGVDIGRSIDKHFSVKAGFQYSKIIAKMIDSNGVGIASQYMSIDVPFLIGYEIKSGGFKTAVTAGMIFNLYSWYKGNNLADYKDYTGISLYMGLNFAKQINSKIALFAAPYFRYRLSYLVTPQAPFDQKIHIAGVLVGVKYNF